MRWAIANRSPNSHGNSSRDDIESGIVLKVPHITCENSEAELKSCGADQQIFEGNANSPLRLLSLNATGKPCDLDCHRMNRYIANEFIDKCLSALPVFGQLRAMDAMCQFYDRYDGNTSFRFPVTVPEILEDLTHSPALPFCRHEYAGIDDQSHDVGFQGLRLRTISSTSAAKSGSSTGAVPVSSSWAFAIAMQSEMVR